MSNGKARVAAIAHAGACTSLLALVFLCLAWELWLSPLRPGGSWVVLKVLPLLAALMGVLRGRRYTMQWASMMILAYFTEGAVRAWSETGLARGLALGEILLSLLFFASALAFAKSMQGGIQVK
jgi:uncharacterized membrane protein